MAETTLTDSLKTDFDPTKTLVGIKTPTQAFERRAELLPKLSKAEADVARAEQEKKAVGAEERAKALEQRASVEKAEIDQARTKLSEVKVPEFQPTREDAMMLSGLASVIATMGLMIGHGGKLSAVRSMNAMTGMLQGWKQGRQDVYQKEKDIYDKEVAKMKALKDEIKTDLEMGMKLWPTDKEAAIAKLESAQAKAGSDSIIGKKIAVMDLNGAVNLLNDFEKLKRHEDDHKARLQEIAARHAAVAAEKTQRVTQQTAMAQRAVNSLGGVASALESIKELPAGTTTGLLPNLQTKDGMMNYVRNTIGRHVTKREAEEMNTIFTGIGRNLASIEGSGVATGLSELSKQMQSGVYINAGVDDPYKVAIKLADIRRIATENIRPAIESGIMPKQQAETAQKLVDRIEKAIPFNTIDVIRASRPEGVTTIGQATEKAVRGKTFATEAEAEAAARRGELKADEKVVIGGVSGTWR